MRVAPPRGEVLQQQDSGTAGASRGVLIRALAATGAALLLAGCHVPGTSSSALTPENSSLTIAAAPQPGDAPLYIAQEKGLLQRSGLTVRIQNYPSVRAELAALRKGKADIAAGDYADFFYAQEQRHSPGMVIVADGYDAGPNVMQVLTLPSSGIVSPLNLRNKTIGTASPQLLPASTTGTPFSLETVATQSVLTNDGLTPGSVQWRPMPGSHLIGALRSGQVNAILVTEPQIYQAESELGAVSVLDSCSGQTGGLPLSGYFALRSFAGPHAAALSAFRSAMLQAQADAGQAAPVQAVMTHFEGLSTQTASLVTLGVYPTTLTAANLQRIANLMFFYGSLRRPLGVASMIFTG